MTALVDMFLFRLFTILLAFLLFCFGFSVDVLAEQELGTEEVERQAVMIYDTVMSPYCPGRTLSGCPSPDARDLRLEVLDWLKGGLSEEQVKERLVNEYGHSIEGEPKASGVGLLAWLAPLAFVIIFLAAILRLIKHKPNSDGAAEVFEDSELPERKVQDLEKFDEREFMESLEQEIDSIVDEEK